MSKKYANNLRLNLPTGEDCLRANAELQRRLLSETEEYAYKIWDRVGGRIISALIESTSDFNPDAAGGRTHDYKLYITLMRNDFMSRFRRKMNKMHKAFLSKMNKWFPSHEVRKRA